MGTAMAFGVESRADIQTRSMPRPGSVKRTLPGNGIAGPRSCRPRVPRNSGEVAEVPDSSVPVPEIRHRQTYSHSSPHLFRNICIPVPCFPQCPANIPDGRALRRFSRILSPTMPESLRTGCFSAHPGRRAGCPCIRVRRPLLGPDRPGQQYERDEYS